MKELKICSPVKPPSEDVCGVDDVFWMELIIFKVEGTLFQIPKHGLAAEGTYFEKIFATSDTASDDGSDTQFIDLEGVSKLHFKAFMKVLYPLFYKSMPNLSSDLDLQDVKVARIKESVRAELNREDWIGVLHLATAWGFSEIRIIAIEALSSRLVLYNMWKKMELVPKYKVKKWLLHEYRELVTNVNPLNSEKLKKGGMPETDIIKLYQIREKYLAVRQRYFYGKQALLDVDEMLGNKN